MHWVFVLFLVLSFVGQVSLGESIQTFDDDFFGSQTTPYQGPGIRALDPEFFGNGKGYMTDTAPGQQGCINIFANSPMAEASEVALAVDRYCDGVASRIWIPRNDTWRKPNQPLGYHQICCVRKSNPSRRRPR